MSDMEFTVEEFVEYWEAKTSDDALGIQWMKMQVQNEEGLAKLQEVATVLARKHGVSSAESKTFRTALGTASQQVGLDPLSTKKTKDGDGFFMSIVPRKRQAAPAPADKATTGARRMRKWMDNDGFSYQDILDAVEKLRINYL